MALGLLALGNFGSPNRVGAQETRPAARANPRSARLLAADFHQGFDHNISEGGEDTSVRRSPVRSRKN